MALTAAFENTATISTTEHSLTNNSTTLASQTTDGIMQAIVDCTAMTVTEQYEIKVAEKVLAAGPQKTIYKTTLTGAQSEAFALPSLIVMHGWDVTVKKIAGTDRTIAWSIRTVA